MFSDQVLSISASIDILSKAIGLTFAYAVVAKMAGFRHLVSGIRRYALVPDRIAGPSAASLIFFEGVIAFTHVSGTALQIIAPATAILLGIFCAITVAALLRGEERPCLCFGANRDDRVDSHTLFRISLLLLCELVLIRNYEFLGSGISAGASMFDWVAALLVGALAASMVSWFLSIPKLQSVRRVLDI